MLKNHKSSHYKKDIEESFDLIDLGDDELREMDLAQAWISNADPEPRCKYLVFNHTYLFYIASTMAIVDREYTMLRNLTKKPSIPHDEEEKHKKSKENNWTSKMKESFGNFLYKVNHSGSAFAQYNKLDYKNCAKNKIHLMCGHTFKKPK